MKDKYPSPASARRIAVIGYSGSGKSTLAARLGAWRGIPVLHLDKVDFLPGWQERDRDEAIAEVAAFMARESWIIDGNYDPLLKRERLAAADLVVFMGFGRLSCLFRALRRFRRYRGRTRGSIAEGCPEKFDAAFVRWILFGGRTREKRRDYAACVGACSGKTAVIRNQRELDRFMRSAGVPEGGEWT